MNAADLLIAAGAGSLAGVVNAVAGGGTHITFPALVGIGLSARAANITSSVGLLPGYAGGTMAYRPEPEGQARRVRRLGVVAVLGGIAGAAVLLVTPSESFRAVAPYLILVSSFLLAAQRRLAWLGGTVGVRVVRHLPPIVLRRAVVVLGVVVAGVMLVV